MSRITLAFDLYGTLLSTESIADYLSSRHGLADAEAIALTWRREQLQYTWRLNSMKQYENFEEVTKKSLLHALSEHGIELADEELGFVLEAYDNLHAFDDVDSALQTLQAEPDIDCVVFSNGTRKMMSNAFNGPGDLSSKSSVFSQLISVDHVRSFKPAPEVYRYLKNCVQGPKADGQLYLISSNPFDVVGAKSVGLRAIWVNRTGRKWADKLGPTPDLVIENLGELVKVIQGAA